MSDFLRVMEDLLSTLWCIFSLLLLPSLLTAAVAAAEADAADAADADADAISSLVDLPMPLLQLHIIYQSYLIFKAEGNKNMCPVLQGLNTQ